MAKKGCKCEEEECECPEWIFTFADLVMLMMGFFVILWVLKPAPGQKNDPASEAKWLDAVAAIRRAFDYLPDPNSKDPVDLHMLMKKIEQMKPLNGPGDGGRTRDPRRGAEGTDPLVTAVRPGKHSITGSRVLFAPGQAALDDAGRGVLNELAVLIKGHRTVVVVKGHTALDDHAEGADAMQRMDAQQKMDLSLRRAQAVADYLVARGVEPDILRVQGCSTFEPIVQRVYSPESRVLNRRVEVEETRLLVSEFQDRGPTGPASQAGPTTATTQPAH